MKNSTEAPAVLGPVERQVRPGAEARWYCVSKDGRATLCADADDATAEVARDTADWPLHAPYTAVQLVDAAQLDAALAAKLEAEALEMSHGEVIERLRAENATFRNAQRACEHCDPAGHAATVAAERERCAKLCDDSSIFDYQDPGGFFAALIRGPGPNA